jgi:hypothetical protein
VACHAQGQGFANSGGSARDQHHFIFEILHAARPEISGIP